MAYARRSYRRRRRTTRRRTWRTRRLFRRRYRRFRRARGTKSAVVKLTAFVSHTFGNGSSWNPFLFTPQALNGFNDYYSTYSHFRILKTRLYIPRDVTVDPGATSAGAVSAVTDLDNNYLVVGSRPYAATTVPNAQAEYNPLLYVPVQPTETLRQSKWQKVIYPNSTRTKITVGFYPYTMIATFGPMWRNTHTGTQYQRIWEARRWMPFTWATSGSSQLPFFGPYIVANGDGKRMTVNLTLEVWLQFKGQK